MALVFKGSDWNGSVCTACAAEISTSLLYTLCTSTYEIWPGNLSTAPTNSNNHTLCLLSGLEKGLSSLKPFYIWLGSLSLNQASALACDARLDLMIAVCLVIKSLMAFCLKSYPVVQGNIFFLYFTPSLLFSLAEMFPEMLDVDVL